MQSTEPLLIGMLPRAPFLAHSEELLHHLLPDVPAGRRQVLEIGCGPCSPLVPMLRRHWPDVELHQIDARPEIVAQAATAYPGVKVEQMLASDMASIPDASKQLVVAMSVFDQNADDLLPNIAREIHRVLVPDGAVVYIHNEELNLPSAAASLLYRSEGNTLLVPSDRWQPGNDLEYCSVERSDLVASLARMDASGEPLSQYLYDVYPRLFGAPQTPSEIWKVPAPVMRDYTPPVMSRIRRAVAVLRRDAGDRLVDHRTSHLLRSHIEDGLFCAQHGFEIERSGYFELRQSTGWHAYFQAPPAASHFVRGTMRFGYATNTAPPPTAECQQQLNRNPASRSEDIMFIAYQYGLVARRIDRR